MFFGEMSKGIERDDDTQPIAVGNPQRIPVRWNESARLSAWEFLNSLCDYKSAGKAVSNRKSSGSLRNVRLAECGTVVAVFGIGPGFPQVPSRRF